MRFVIVENRQLLPQASLSGPARIPGTKPHSPQQPYELSALWLLMPSNSNRVLKKIFFFLLPYTLDSGTLGSSFHVGEVKFLSPWAAVSSRPGAPPWAMLSPGAGLRPERIYFMSHSLKTELDTTYLQLNFQEICPFTQPFTKRPL